MSIRAKRGTRAQLDAAAGAGSLKTGEMLYITDEEKFAVATGTGAYSEVGNAPDATDTVKGIVELATAAEIAAGTAGKVITADGLEAALEPNAFSVASTTSIPWSSHLVNRVTCTGNSGINTVLDEEPVTSRMLIFFGNNSTERTISWGSVFKGEIPEETVTSTKGLMVVMTALATGYIVLTWKVIE